VWKAPADDWRRSTIAGSDNAFALIDPPEKEDYKRAAPCRVVMLVSNNAKDHYKNILKDGELLLTSMPTEPEMLAMTPVLFTERTALLGQDIDLTDDAVMKKEVLERCALVGCVPRHVFSHKQFEAGLNAIVRRARAVAVEKRTEALIQYSYGAVTTSDDNDASSVSSSIYDIDPSPDSRRKPFIRLKALAVWVWLDELKQHFSDLNGKVAFRYEDHCGLLLRGFGSFDGTKLPQRTLLPTTSQKHTSALIRGKKGDNSVVVVASTGYPVLDYATSLYGWYNAKVGESAPTVNSGAFVSLLLNLDLAYKKESKLVMKEEHEEAKITLTMMRNNAGTTFAFKDDAGKNHKDLKFSDVEELFQKHVTVKYIDTSKWDARGDYNKAEIDKLLIKYKDQLPAETFNSFFKK